MGTLGYPGYVGLTVPSPALPSRTLSSSCVDAVGSTLYDGVLDDGDGDGDSDDEGAAGPSWAVKKRSTGAGPWQPPREALAEQKLLEAFWRIVDSRMAMGYFRGFILAWRYSNGSVALAQGPSTGFVSVEAWELWGIRDMLV